MVARITNTNVTDVFIDQLFQVRLALEKKRNEISTGQKINTPSDDPGRSGIVNVLQATVQRLDRHKERISFAVSLLELQENVVQSAENIIIRAKELASQAANGSMSGEVRAQIADEVFELRDSLASLANTKHQGRYIYGGLDDDDPPFDLNKTFYTEPPSLAPNPEKAEKGHWAFDDATVELGQTSTRSIKISDSDEIRIISSGGQVFKDALNAMEMLGRAMKGYRTGLDANGNPDGSGAAYTLPAEDAKQVQDILGALDALESARINNIQTEISNIGARINRLEKTTEMIDNLKLNTEKARSSIQDADVFQTASEFSNLQVALEGLLSAGSQINSLSLLNYL